MASVERAERVKANVAKMVASLLKDAPDWLQLETQGKVLLDRKYNDLAVEVFQQALDAFKVGASEDEKEKFSEFVMGVYNQIGSCYLSTDLRDLDKAVEYFRIAVDEGNKPEIQRKSYLRGTILENLAITLQMNGKTGESLDVYSRALSVFRELKSSFEDDSKDDVQIKKYFREFSKVSRGFSQVLSSSGKHEEAKAIAFESLSALDFLNEKKAGDLREDYILSRFALLQSLNGLKLLDEAQELSVSLFEQVSAFLEDGKTKHGIPLEDLYKECKVAKENLRKSKQIPDKSSLCSSSGCGNAGTLLCSRCKKVRYCSAECQRKEWSSHKKHCHKEE